MTTPATTATDATFKKGAFNCFPLKFLFQANPAEQAKPMAEKAIKVEPSEATTDSYGGNSSVMSVDQVSSDDEHKCAAPGAPVVLMSAPSANGQAGQACPPVRMISGYEVLDTLGKGMSGKVKRGLSRERGQYVALKIIDKASAPRRVLQMLHTEIEAMKSLSQQPHVLQLLHYDLQAQYPKKHGGTRDVVLLALELAEGGELFDFMMHTGAFSEPLSRGLFKQMTSALAYCHERGIYHRDIKPENLLLDANFQLKVADFGLAAMRHSNEELLKTECGTRSYMAPEVLSRQTYEGAKADCWSAGVVLFIMLSGNPPFQMARAGDWWFNQFLEGRPDRFWKSHKRYSPHFPDAAQALLTRVFSPNPLQRPTVSDLLSDPWLQAPSLSPEEIRAELAARKAKILAEKEAEKERAKRRKAAGQYGPRAGREMDPDKVKHRDLPGLDGTPTTLSLPIPEQPAPMASKEALACLTNLYSPESPLYVSHRLLEALEMMSARVSCAKSPYHLRAMVPAEGSDQSLHIEVKILSLPDDEGVLVISVSRQGGDPLAFQRAFQRLRAATLDLHGEEGETQGSSKGGAGGPEPLGDVDDVEVVLERGSSEMALDEEVGMI